MATGTSGDERGDEFTNAKSEGVDAEATDDTESVDASDSVEDAGEMGSDVNAEASDASTADDAEEVSDEDSSKSTSSSTTAAAAAAAGSKTVVKDKRQKQGKTLKRSEAEAATAKANKENPLARFFGEVMAEIKKVVTPTRKELWRYVAVVIGFLIIVMGLVALFDFLANFLASWAFGEGTDLFPQQAPPPVEEVPAG